MLRVSQNYTTVPSKSPTILAPDGIVLPPADNESTTSVAHFRVAAPSRPQVDRAAHLVLTVDVSGSMGSLVQAVSADGSKESNGFTLLDLVKHSLLTILASLGGDSASINNDASNNTTRQNQPEPDMEPEGSNGTRFLSLIKFTTTAEVVFEKLDMASATDRATALTKIRALQPERTTNLWGGLQKSLEICKNSLSADSSTPCEILLFTDGLPNVAPSRGSHVRAFEHSLATKMTEQTRDLVTLRTYGFGYSLDAKLLDELARVGKGSFSFIPDSGFVGTIFIHSLASILSVCDAVRSKKLCLELQKTNDSGNVGDISGNVNVADYRFPGLQAERDFAQPVSLANGGVRIEIPLRGLEFGQPRDVVCELSAGVEVKKVYLADGLTNEKVHLANDANCYLTKDLTSRATCAQWARQSLVALLQSLVDAKQRAFGEEGQFYANATASADEVAEKHKLVSAVVELLQGLEKNLLKEDVADDSLEETSAGSDKGSSNGSSGGSSGGSVESNAAGQDKAALEFLAALLTDVSGQVVEATSTEDYYERWGATYLRSLLGAHRAQRRNNFKDPGLQLYNNSTSSTGAVCFFEQTVSDINDIFDNLTPPKPSAVRSSQSNYAPVRSMAAYNNSYGPCFSPDTLVKMADGSAQRADTLRKGSVILTGLTHTPARVQCVIATSGAGLSVIRLRGAVEDAVSSQEEEDKIDSDTDFDTDSDTDRMENVTPATSAGLSSLNSTSFGLSSSHTGSPCDSTCSMDSAVWVSARKRGENDASPATQRAHAELGSFGITPWHPMFDAVAQHWVFPRDILALSKITSAKKAKTVSKICDAATISDATSLHFIGDAAVENENDPCWGLSPTANAFAVTKPLETTPTVYNFLLESDVDDKTMLIGGAGIGTDGVGESNAVWTTTCTLGHGLASDAVISHAYFGNYARVSADLSTMTGWEAGLVKLEAETCCVKDSEAKVSGMVQKAV